jgi:hypothetical protein
MPRNYSRSFQETINRTGAPEVPRVLLEISHPGLATPVRVVNDVLDLVSNGNTYTALAFRVTLPDDLDQGQPRATIAIDNVGRDLTAWIESSAGAKGATVRFMQVMRSAPDVIEWEVTLDLNNVRMNMLEISGQLGFDDILNLPAIPLTYRPDVAPGLF